MFLQSAFLLSKKVLILQEKYIGWKLRFILYGFLLNEWRDEEKPERKWQNSLRTSQQNVQWIFVYCLTELSQSWCEQCNLFAWVLLWFGNKPATLWLESFHCEIYQCTLECHWCKGLKRTMYVFETLHIGGKILVTLKYYPQCCWHRFAIGKNFICTWMSEFPFRLFGSSTILSLIALWLCTHCPGLDHVTATKQAGWPW
jgi:hypothetical protein